ncbi:sigma 54-interacting transcriptional regulator [Psychrobacter arenosus]|uniref:sigma 54-interacting transcriptional regulator n=1 Tax=Psychrobacter arenosus TaxID=256326 RepID=UPI001918DBFC|nr:sigma 54-interacting transcriptional regulator [Psychrobacter arenosus]
MSRPEFNQAVDPAPDVSADQSTLWLIDDDPALRLILADTFSDAQMTVISFTQAKAAWTRLNDVLHSGDRSELPDVILTDIRMPLMDGLSFSDWVHNNFPELPIIIMTAHSDLQSAVDSYQTGAFDYLPKPFDLDDAVAVVKKAIKPRTGFNGATTNTATVTTDVAPTSMTAKGNAQDQCHQVTATSANDNAMTASQTVVSPNAIGSANRSINSSASLSNSTLSNTSNTLNTAADKPRSKAPTKTTSSHSNSISRTSSQATPMTNGATSENPNGIIGQSVAMQTVFRAIGRLSHSPITVLITGESGTGKELVANALHQHSPRRNNPFIALNMAAIPHDLIESELFGHEKGAFTGAAAMRQGRFEQANGGTLFLDEIGDMPFSTQTRLLRVLANGEFYRVGGQKPIKVDVRIIAATHQNLEHLVKLGKFREDLFYRLNVIRLPLPPLRQRREDIPALVQHFMQSAAQEMDTEQKYIAPEALAIMQAFDWSGNVRQIENVCRWLTVMATGDTVLAEDLPPELLEFVQSSTQQDGVANSHAGALAHVNSPSISNAADTTALSAPVLHTESLATGLTQPPTTISANSLATNSLNHVMTPDATGIPQWQQALEQWAHQALANGETEILQSAAPEFERVLLTVALAHTKGRKGDAATLLGWGRNTLTRKLKQLNID